MIKPRIILWFVAEDGRFISAALDILERQHNGVEIVGVTAIEEIFVDDWPFIPLNEISLNGGGYDVLLVVGARNFGMSEVVKFANQIKLDTEKLLGDWIVCIPGFTLKKYRQLQKSKISIFAMNCFGGLISNTLGLPFRAPFVNMFMEKDEYIRFLKSPRVYMEENVIYQKDDWEGNLKRYFPICTLGNVSLFFNHYKNFDEAVTKWNERKQRINWYNLFVTMYTEDPEILEQFDALPYGKKVCFVPFKSDLESAWYINREISRDVKEWWQVVNDFGEGNPFYYDVFDMLLYGKQTQLIDM